MALAMMRMFGSTDLTTSTILIIFSSLGIAITTVFAFSMFTFSRIFFLAAFPKIIFTPLLLPFSTSEWSLSITM